MRENKGRDAKRRPRGKRAGVRNRLRVRAHRTPLPSILLANVQSLENKLDDLRARAEFQRDIRDCNLLCFTKTWLNPAVPDHAIQPAQSVPALQDALDDADWDMFRNSSDDVNVFTEAVVGFIGKLADDTAQKMTIRTFPNQKPWVDKTIRDALRSRTAAYNLRDLCRGTWTRIRQRHITCGRR
ncbi:leucine-rich repeat-containing 24-like protein [Labeo rohita]|nr:leucine-rich repeat-containing 24-like protein [Labeo rohita]